MWLAYHSSLHGSTGSILDRAYINQLASSDSSLSSRNIVLKASVTVEGKIKEYAIKDKITEETVEVKRNYLSMLAIYYSRITPLIERACKDIL